MLERHLLIASSYATYRLLHHGQTRGPKSSGKMLDAETAKCVIQQEKLFFYLQTTMRLAHMGNKARREVFQLSYYLTSNGLSKRARNVMARFGLGISEGSYITAKKALVKKAVAESKYVFGSYM